MPERFEEEIIARRAKVRHLEKVRADNLGDRNQLRTGLPSLPTWKQKKKIHAGKRQGSKLAPFDEKKRKTDKVQVLVSLEQRVRLLWESEESNSARRVICISGDEDAKKPGSGQTPSVLELDSIVLIWSSAKPCGDESTDSVYREIQDLLDKPVPSGSKEIPKTSNGSVSKVGMSAKKVKKTRSGSKVTDSRVYSYYEIIECQAKLYDSNDFQFSINDVEKEF